MKPTQDYVIEQIAKAGYERHFDDKWDNLHPKSIERALWKEIAKTMLDALRALREINKRLTNT